MLFNSYEFIFLFLPITFFIYFYLNKKRLTEASKGFLVVSSLFFYSWWNIIYLPLILVSMLFNYVIGKSLTKEEEHIKLIDFISSIKIQNEKITQTENIEERDNEYRNSHSAIQSQKVWDEWTTTILDIQNNFDGKFYIVLTVPRSIYRDNQKKEYEYWLNKELKKFCSQNNIFFIDTLDYLKNRKDDLYLDYIHFNTNGHAKIAEILKVLL